MVKCNMCDFEYSGIDSDEGDTILERHKMEVHPESMVWSGLVTTIVELHHKYNAPIEQLVADYYAARSLLAAEEVKRFGK